MKNPLYQWLMPVLAIGATVLGFLLLMPDEPTALFWTNLTWSLALVVLFFVWLRWGRWTSRFVDEQTTYFRVFLGVGTWYYIVASVAWMMVYFAYGTEAGRSLLRVYLRHGKILEHLPEMSIRIYLFGILVLTVTWVVLATVMGRHDVAYNSQQTALENATADVRDFVAELRDLAAEHQTAQTKRAWAALIREAESVPPRQLQSKIDFLRQRANKLIG